MHPVLISHKIKDELKAKKPKHSIVNQRNVVYLFECDLCDAGYVGFESRHLHQRVEDHNGSVMGNHVSEQHRNEECEIAKNFRVLRKCSTKFAVQRLKSRSYFLSLVFITKQLKWFRKWQNFTQITLFQRSSPGVSEKKEKNGSTLQSPFILVSWANETLRWRHKVN